MRYPDLQTAEFAAVNPLKKVPALVRADGVTVFESNVILDYLEVIYLSLSLSSRGRDGASHIRTGRRFTTRDEAPHLWTGRRSFATTRNERPNARRSKGVHVWWPCASIAARAIDVSRRGRAP